jgi:hypothetical protein
MKPRFSIRREAIHPLICHSFKHNVSYENITEFLSYNTILEFINIFLIDILQVSRINFNY